MVMLPALLGTPFHLWTGHEHTDSDSGIKLERNTRDDEWLVSANDNAQPHIVGLQQRPHSYSHGQAVCGSHSSVLCYQEHLVKHG